MRSLKERRRQTFGFTLTVRPRGGDEDEYADRFYEAGCTDALVSVIDGNVLLDFARDAEDLQAAILSAMLDVQRANAAVLKVAPMEDVRVPA